MQSHEGVARMGKEVVKKGVIGGSEDDGCR